METFMPRFSLLDVDVDALSRSELLNVIEQAIETDQSNYIVGNHNLHSVYLCRKDAEMRRFYEHAGTIHIDGMSLVMLGKLLGLPLSRHHRTGYLDWFDDFLALAKKKHWRLYFVGGTPEVAARVPGLLNRRYPGLAVAAHHGYLGGNLGAAERAQVYREIEALQPQVLLVGMGMPLQEHFILESLHSVEVNVILQCGAIMDFYAGEKRPAPRILGQLGLEWLFRLGSEPRRLASRYLAEPVHLLPPLLREMLPRMRVQPGSIAIRR